MVYVAEGEERKVDILNTLQKHTQRSSIRLKDLEYQIWIFIYVRRPSAVQHVNIYRRMQEIGLINIVSLSE